MKKWYQSQTIGGIIIALVGSVFLYFGMDAGFDIPANVDVEQAKTYIDQIKHADSSIPTILGIILNAVGYVMSFLGRLKAKTPIAPIAP